ncbi:MAG: DUF5946 family protein [Cyanobacteria bacterium J06648_11]
MLLPSVATQIESDRAMDVDICTGCGLKTEPHDGPTHTYLVSSSGCWAKYGELLAREYQDIGYMAVHGLTVDAYALQHPGQENPQTIQSARVHLASLFSYFEFGTPISDLNGVKQAIARHRTEFTWLVPPPALTDINVSDVLTAETAIQHAQRVKVWAEYVFVGWKSHHAEISRQLKACL